MEITTTIFLIILGLSFIIIGFILKDRIANLLFLPIAGGVLLIILGLALFTDPINYQTGSQSEISENEVITAYEYTNIDNTTNNILAWVITLIGLINIIITSIMIYDKRFEEEKTYEW